MASLILKVASIAGAILTIGTLIGVLISKVKKMINFFRQLMNRVENIDRHQKETYLTTLRLTIMADEVPLEERLKAGDEYIKNGGNGAVKAYFETLKEEYQEEVKKE